MKPSTRDALLLEHGSQLVEVFAVLLHELHVEPAARVTGDAALRVEVATRIGAVLLTRYERALPSKPAGGRLENPEPAMPALSITPRAMS
jgi:hypothetical protein